MSTLEYTPHSQTVYKASPQSNERMYYLYSAFSAGGFGWSAVKEIFSRQRSGNNGQIRGKSKRNWKLEIVFPSE